MFLNIYNRNQSRNNLWADLDKLQEELANSFFKPSSLNGGTPSINLYQNADEVVVTALVPGYDAESIEMNVVDNRFLLKGNPKKETNDGYTLVREEINTSEFMRSFDLPFKINSERVEANLKNGVLVVKLPKAEEEKAKKITVKSE
jgi:HSP20 family protein